jgi:nitrite reductase (NO-forming)
MKSIQLVMVVVLVSFLVACGGSSNQGGQASGPVSVATPKPTGEDIYKKTCIACHQAAGQGVPGAFPPLAKSDYLAHKDLVIKQVLKGSSGDIVVNGANYNGVMPPQALNDEEIASVLTYVYSNFGNNGGTITPDEVKQERTRQ